MRFYVGQDEEKSIVRLNQKLFANFDLIPPGASQPLVKPRSIDDVPILALTLSSRRYNDFDLRRIAAQLDDTIKQVPDVSAVTLMGGQRREVRIVLDPAKLAGYHMSPLQVAGALGLSNRRLPSGKFDSGNREYLLETGEFLRTSEDVRNVVVGVAGDKPVFLRNVAEVADGGAEPTEYVRMVNAASKESLPAVTISIAKRKGTNAVEVAGNVLRRIEPLKGVVIPSDVALDITRQYGETAAEKSNELLLHMLIAVISVSLLIAITLGLTRVPDRLPGHPGHARAHACRVLPLRLHAEPDHAFRPDLFHRHPGGRRHCDRGEYCPPLAYAGEPRPPAVRSGRRGRRRGGQSHHPGHPHGGRRHPAHGVCRRADGAVHAADSRSAPVPPWSSRCWSR